MQILRSAPDQALGGYARKPPLGEHPAGPVGQIADGLRQQLPPGVEPVVRGQLPQNVPFTGEGGGQPVRSWGA